MTRTIHFTENLQASPQILMSEPQKTISTRNKLDFQSHINTDQYTCGFESCELSFSRQSDLVRHKVSIHGPKASCTSQKCGYTTSQADKPNQHQLDGYISFERNNPRKVCAQEKKSLTGMQLVTPSTFAVLGLGNHITAGAQPVSFNISHNDDPEPNTSGFNTNPDFNSEISLENTGTETPNFNRSFDSNSEISIESMSTETQDDLCWPDDIKLNDCTLYPSKIVSEVVGLNIDSSAPKCERHGNQASSNELQI